MRPAFRQRFLMVYFLDRHKNSFPIALLTERVRLYIAVTDSFPCTPVPTAYSRVPAILLVAFVHKSRVFLTEPPVSQFRTAGVGTRPFWFSRHQLHLLLGIKKATHRISPMNGSAFTQISMILSYHVSLCQTTAKCANLNPARKNFSKPMHGCGGQCGLKHGAFLQSPPKCSY